MRKLLKFITILSLAGLFALSPSSAEAGAGKRKGASPARLIGRFDRNKDLKIDGQEAARLRAMYSALYALDTDHDGQLSDSEISAAKVETPKRRKKSAN